LDSRQRETREKNLGVLRGYVATLTLENDGVGPTWTDLWKKTGFHPKTLTTLLEILIEEGKVRRVPVEARSAHHHGQTARFMIPEGRPPKSPESVMGKILRDQRQVPEGTDTRSLVGNQVRRWVLEDLHILRAVRGKGWEQVRSDAFNVVMYRMGEWEQFSERLKTLGDAGKVLGDLISEAKSRE
jgi:hypothetical protein